MKKSILLVVLMIVFLRPLGAQKPVYFYSFKGFHVGITGQAEFIEKCSYLYLTGIDLAPKPRWTSGWEAGIEFSYHFAKYFGVSFGINYGTVLSYERAIDISNYPDMEFMKGKINRYHSSVIRMNDHEILFPIKFEFHYPLRKDLFFTAEAGVKIKGVNERLSYGKYGIGTYNTGCYLPLTPDDWNPETNAYYPKPYYNDWGYRDMSKISCNLLLGIGLYYKLPYGDLVRFTAGINMSFNNIIEGYYKYYPTENNPTGSYGTFAVKNNFIYTQLSYIHTLNWQKAKKYVKKQEYSFSSKKERRGKILEVLKDW